MAITRICKQCGELKPIEQYRKYYSGRNGRYRTCKLCEKINARAKYLRAKETLTAEETVEYEKIQILYAAQRAAGLQPPRESAGRSNALMNSVDDMLAKYSNTPAPDAIGGTAVAPAELQSWLTCELTEDPDYYTDEVYERLCNEYRPMLRIDANNKPVYDETHKDILNQILTRFYDYEDTYYDKEDN